MFAIIFDTETTGIDAPDVIQLAHTPLLAKPLSEPIGDTVTHWFKPTKPISLGALSTHHIVADDLQSYQVWPGKWTPPDGVTYVVGHSVDFDWEAVGKPNVKRICTLALARSVSPLLDSHKLGALMYMLYPHGMARDIVKNAHNAAADVDMCARLLFALYDAVGRPATWEQMWQISEKARVPKYISFGKYGPSKCPPSGMLISEMRKVDRGYVSWLLNNVDQVKEDPYLQKALRGEA